MFTLSMNWTIIYQVLWLSLKNGLRTIKSPSSVLGTDLSADDYDVRFLLIFYVVVLVLSEICAVVFKGIASLKTYLD